MATRSTIRGKVTEVYRQMNSADGNPRWRLTLDTPAGPISRSTAPDTTVAFEITDSLLGKTVDLTIEASGIIDVAEPGGAQ